MARLNTNIDDKYLDALNIFKVSNKSEIELKFNKKSDQQMAIQFIICEYMKQNNISHIIEILENNKE